jgi:hypothetical protein
MDFAELDFAELDFFFDPPVLYCDIFLRLASV